MGEADLGDDDTEEAGDTEEARERRVLQILSGSVSNMNRYFFIFTKWQ